METSRYFTVKEAMLAPSFDGGTKSLKLPWQVSRAIFVFSGLVRDLCLPAPGVSLCFMVGSQRGGGARSWSTEPAAVCFISPGGITGLALIIQLSFSDGGNTGFSCRCSDTHGFVDVTCILRGAQFY